MRLPTFRISALICLIATVACAPAPESSGVGTGVVEIDIDPVILR